MEKCFTLCKAAYTGNGLYFWGFRGSGGCEGRCPCREDLAQQGLWGTRKTAATDFPTLMWDRELALQHVGLPGWAGPCSVWWMNHEAEGNEISLAAQLPQIFLLPIINYHPVLFSFYSLFQDVSGIYSLLGANCVRNGFLGFIFLCRHLKVLATDPAPDWGWGGLSRPPVG